MNEAKPKLRWYRLTPDRLVLLLLAVECLLLLSSLFQWFEFNRHRGWTVLIALACMGATFLVMLLWFIIALIFRRRLRFSILSVLLLVAAVAIPCFWLAVERDKARRQREEVRGLTCNWNQPCSPNVEPPSRWRTRRLRSTIEITLLRNPLMPCRIFWPFLLLPALFSRVQAAVDLVTLPTREGTQLTIYNSEDITMVREHRLLTVKEGVNRIQFSWANTLIDPTSIEFRILDHQEKVDLVDTTFPAGRNDALQWNIKSQMAGKIPVEIRYFTSGITWAADYVGIANEDETKLNVTGYVRVTNGSGEQYDNAQTRLVVGKINLVEKIADLARRPAPGKLQSEIMNRALMAEMRRMHANANPSFRMGLAGSMKDAMDRLDEVRKEEPKQVIKQGLSEYFLFTIEGREDIKDKEPKRLVALKVAEVPLETIYKLSDRSSPRSLTGEGPGVREQFTKF